MLRAPTLLRFLLVAGLFSATALRAQTVVNVSLTAGDANKVDLGFFAGGTLLQLSATGQGDLVGSNYQVFADGSLAATATSPYAFANSGAAYPSVGGFPAGDGFNHFTGGGANYDFAGSGWMFAGTQTTDTTDPSAIRAGALVGTFSLSPVRADWFFIGLGRSFVVPGGGANLYLAVNDSFNADNHGTYAVTYAAIPEPSGLALGAAVAAAMFVGWRRRKIAG
jgi:hypothetical protein